MRSPTSLHESRVYRQKKFYHECKKDFCNKICHKETYAVQQMESLLDHLVGADEDRRGNNEAKRLGGLEVDYELELGRLHYGKVGRLCTLRILPAYMPTWRYASATLAA